MRMKRIKSAVLLGALACIPLMAGGCKPGRASDDAGRRVSSAKSHSGSASARKVPRPKRGSTLMGGGSLSAGGSSLSAGSSLTGGSSTRGPDSGAAPSRGGGL